jgi:hypothetical protein
MLMLLCAGVALVAGFVIGRLARNSDLPAHEATLDASPRPRVAGLRPAKPLPPLRRQPRAVSAPVAVDGSPTPEPQTGSTSGGDDSGGPSPTPPPAQPQPTQPKPSPPREPITTSG